MAPANTTKKAVGNPAGRGYESPRKPAKTYVSAEISLEPLDIEFSRADLEFEGVDHSGVSFEARVFLNNKKADARTSKTPGNGYAGSFHIFGHGGCFGDVGHCDVRGLPRHYDPRPAHALTPARKIVVATDAIRRALRHGKSMTVSVVPIVTSATSRCDFENVLKFDRVSVVTYL
jgi:tyrosinase